MEKLKMSSSNIVNENIEFIASRFPNALVEAKDDNGNITKMIDFDILKQELSSIVVDGDKERYTMTWPDKKQAILTANAPIAKTLRPCKAESVGKDGTNGGFDSENLYIEGDNLDVLKLLRETYLGKVKMIYIDPPYNTGNDFVYNDDFATDTEDYLLRSNQIDEEGNRMVANNDSNGRFHTDWLNMIYPRLKLARDLLSDDGVIFISIDDNEEENLKKVCDEIFGEINSQAVISYVRKTSGKQDSTNFMRSTEFVLVYSKSSAWECAPIIADDKVTDRYNKATDNGQRYRETDLRKTGNSDRREDRPLMFYPFYYNPTTQSLLVEEKANLELVRQGYIEIYPIKPDGSDGRWRWGKATAESNIEFLVAKEMPKYKGKYTIYEMDFIDKNGDVRTVKEHTFWNKKEFNSDNAMLEFKNLGFSNQLFPYPKSSALIKHMCFLANDKDAIILDFFSGSATTAHAVMQLNAEDNGKRKFIMVQLPEQCDEKSEAYKAGYKNICEIGKERIRRAGKKIKQDNPLNTQNLDTGFRVLKLDSSCMKDVYYNPFDIKQDLLSQFENNIKEDRSPEDLLFQVMLDMGVLLSSEIKTFELNGKTVFNVNDGNLICCFDSDLTDDVVTEIAKMQPLYAVFRDSSFNTDSVAVNFDQIFETYSPTTTRKII